MSKFDTMAQNCLQLFSHHGDQLQESDDEPIEQIADSFASDEPIANYVNRIRSRARNQADSAFPTTIPRFSPLKYSSRRSSTKGNAKIPDEASLSEPLDLLQHFYNPAIMQELVTNTKKNYAIVNTDGESRRAWRDVNAADLLQFVGVILYMGLHSEPSVADYWSNNPYMPNHPTKCYMSLKRFQQIKRFFQVCDPLGDNGQSFFFN